MVRGLLLAGFEHSRLFLCFSPAHMEPPGWAHSLLHKVESGSRVVHAPCKEWLLLLWVSFLSLERGRLECSTATGSRLQGCRQRGLSDVGSYVRLCSWEFLAGTLLPVDVGSCLTENFCEIIFHVFESPDHATVEKHQLSLLSHPIPSPTILLPTKD